MCDDLILLILLIFPSAPAGTLLSLLLEKSKFWGGISFLFVVVKPEAKQSCILLALSLLDLDRGNNFLFAMDASIFLHSSSGNKRKKLETYAEGNGAPTPGQAAI